MEIKFFTMQLDNVQGLKIAYKNLIKKNHPDVGGSNEDMKTINAEYEFLFNNVHELERAGMTEEDKKTDFHDVNDNFRQVVEKFIFVDGLEIDLVKSWLWVGGNTFPHAQLFRDNNFKFSNSKKKWYWYNGIEHQQNKKFYSHCKTYEDVKKRHGYSRVYQEDKKQLACAR